MKTKAEQIEMLLRGEAPPANAGIFGATLEEKDCKLIIIPVPWDGTASYGKGTALAPDAIRKASHQLDLEDLFFDRPYQKGIRMLKIPEDILLMNGLSSQRKLTPGEKCYRSRIINQYVYRQAKRLLAEGKIVGVLGGEHSVPLGLIDALEEKCSNFGILHIDAHHDLRAGYEGFDFSHASIMYNVMETFPLLKLCQVGVRDFCAQERAYSNALGQRAKVFYWQNIFQKIDEGISFRAIIDEVSDFLPKKIYISFDIDGLDPSNCPNTGTPVPGGLSFSQAVYLIEGLSVNHKIIGFDLCEVAPGGGSDWDCNVGARVLYKLCGAALK
jgi:agmatinase